MERVIGVKKLVLHPNYKGDSDNNDLGLMYLDEELIFDEYVMPACLPSATVKTGTLCVAVGWGETQG